MSVYFEDHAVEGDHGRRSLRAGAMILGARVLIIAIQLVTFGVLARLLFPEDYGLVAMVTAITVFAPLLAGLGTPDAVVQRARITESEISALFWIGVATGAGIAALMVACGPLLARFYGEPRLTWITGVSGLTFLVCAISCQHYTLLRRAMRFEELAVVDVGANLLSASGAVAMAFCGFGYWALVLRPVMLTSFIAVGVWVRCRWVPGRLVMSVGTKQMLRQGFHAAGFFMTDYVASSSDRIVIGHQNGAVALGYYQNAIFIYENLCNLLILWAHGVVVASLGKAQSDLKEVRRLWSKALLTLGFYAMPAFGVLAVTGQDLVVVLFGSKWSETGVLVSILAFRGIPHTIERTVGWLHVAAGRTDRWWRWGLIAMCVQLVALFCGVPYGPIGVAVALVACTFILSIPAVAYSGRPLGIFATDVMSVTWRPLAASLLAAAIGLVLRFTVLTDMSLILRISILTSSYLISYIFIMALVFREVTPIHIFVRFAKGIASACFTELMKRRRVLGGRS